MPKTQDQVTNRQLYELVDNRTSNIMDKFDKLEIRVGTLERWQANIMGKLAIVSIIVSTLVAFIIAEVKSKLRG